MCTVDEVWRHYDNYTMFNIWRLPCSKKTDFDILRDLKEKYARRAFLPPMFQRREIKHIHMDACVHEIMRKKIWEWKNVLFWRSWDVGEWIKIVCVCVHSHVFMCVCIHVCVYMCVYMYTFTVCVCVWVCEHAYSLVDVCVCACAHIHRYVCAFTCVYVCVCVYLCADMCI